MFNNKFRIASSLTLMMCMMLLLPIVSAGDMLFDNVKDYNEETKTVTIYNAFDLPLLGTKIAEVTLLTPQSVPVFPGRDRKVAEFEINLSYDTYDNPLQSMSLVCNGRDDGRKIVSKKKVVTPTIVPNIITQCTDNKEGLKDGNGTAVQECSQVEDGTITIDEVTWEDYSLERIQIQKGSVTIGLFTEVLPNDNCDWVPEIFGAKVSEWAVWTDAFNVGLVAYFDGNTTSNLITYNPEVNLTNLEGTALYGSTDTTCKIGMCINVSTGNNFMVKQNTKSNISSNDNTLAFWVKGQSNGANPYLMGSPTNGKQQIGWDTPPSVTYSASWMGTSGGKYNTAYNTWWFITITKNATGTYLYSNGTLVASGVGSMTDENLYFGNIFNLAFDWDGQFDEIGFWNRSLSPTDVSDLWNGGTGLTYAVNSINPTQGTPILSSTFGTNLTSENLTVYNVSTSDPNNLSVKNIINWNVNTQSLAILNMPFEGGSNSTWTKDYSGNGNNGSVTNAVWNSTGGYDGKGAYEFNSTAQTTRINMATSVASQIGLLTITAWIKPTEVRATGIVSSGSNFLISLTALNKTLFRVINESGAISPFVASTNGVNINQWNHIAGTWNGTTITYYINGQKDTEFAFTGTKINGTAVIISIGTQQDAPGNNFTGAIDDVMIYNQSLTSQQILALYNNMTNTIVSQETSFGETWNACITPNNGLVDGEMKCSNNLTILNIPPISIAVNLNAPTDYTNTSTSSITFNSSAIISYGEIVNATLWFNDTGLFNYTALTSATNYSNLSRTFVADGIYKWNVLYCAENSTGSLCEYASANYTIKIDLNAPDVVLNFPIANQIVGSFPAQVNLSFNASDLNLDSCFYNSTETPSYTTFACNTLQTLNFSTPGVKSVTFGANDTYGRSNISSMNFTIGQYSVLESADPVSEGGSAFFNLTLEYVNIPTSTAVLVWNNTQYTPDSQVVTANQSVFGYRLIVPVGSGNSTGNLINWNWLFNVSNGVAISNSTSTMTQTVFSPSLSDCSSGGTLILNFSQYDEATRSLINSTLNGNNLQVDLTLSSLIDNSAEFTYSSTVINSSSLLVCVADGVLNNTSYKLDLTGSYVATDYVQEFFYIDNGTITLANSPQEYNWYSLLLVDSTTFLFTFLDENGIEVAGTVIETLRYYIGEGVFVEVERSKEDNNGETHIHLVEEDVIYKFRITLQNSEVFLSDQYNAKCLSSPCSITLSAEPTNPQFPTVYNNLPEGTYLVETNKTTRDVTLSFNLNQTGTMNLTLFTSNNNEVEFVASATTTASAGQVTVNVPLQYQNATYSAVIYLNDDFVASRVVDLSESANDYFGALGLFLGALAILVLALIGASHGEWVVIWVVLGLITVSIMFLVDLPWYALMTFIAGAGLFLIKLISRRRN